MRGAADVEGCELSKEITIEDLAAEATSAASSGGGSTAANAAAEAADEDTGQWVLDLYERLEDDGMLQAILFGPDALEPPETVDAPTPEAGGVDVDAEVVADALEDVQETVGDLRISQLVQLTRDNPELVDSLLEDHLAASAEAKSDLEDSSSDLDPEADDGN